MSWLWLAFATLAVVGGASYTVCMKYGAANANPFFFGFITALAVVVIQGVACLVLKYGLHTDLAQGMTPQTYKFAGLCGAASALIGITYFLALRYGSIIPTQTYWAIGDIVLTSTLALALFGETMTWMKALGMVMGAASIVLILKSP